MTPLSGMGDGKKPKEPQFGQITVGTDGQQDGSKQGHLFMCFACGTLQAMRKGKMYCPGCDTRVDDN